MTIRAVAWDIDGTLIDSEPLHHEALLAVCRSWQVDLSDVSEERFIGITMPAVWRLIADRMPPTLTESAWEAAILDYYAARSVGLSSTPGAVEAIENLAELGFEQACVSNSGRRIVDANILALGIKKHVAFSISVDDVQRGKPDPEPYATACAKLALPPRQVLAVEDSLTGLQSARSAGLVTVFFDPSRRTEAQADFIIPHLQLVPEIARRFTAGTLARLRENYDQGVSN